MKQPEGHFSSCNSHDIHYIDTGSGDPLVLLHGGGPGASGWSNYSRNVEVLSERYRVIIPDLPGYGDSSKTSIQGPRFTAYASAMARLLDNLNIEKAHFIGNSLGGGTALKLALDAPDRIKKLILMGPAGLITACGKSPTEGMRMIFNYYEGSGPSREKLNAFIRLMVHEDENVSDELVDGRYQASIAPDILENPPLGKGNIPVLEELWREAGLSTLPHETLILWGREDRVNPLATADILMNQLPNARMVSFSKCGHWVQWERAKAFNSIVTAFLANDAVV